MADAKTSAITNVTAVADTTEWHVSEAGTDKALSVGDLLAYFIRRKNLGTDMTISSTTMSEATNLALPLVAGTWMYTYYLMWQTTATATAIKLGINFDGTATRFVHEATGFEATTAAATGAQDQTHAAFGLRAGGQNNALSTTVSIFGPTSVITADVDTFTVIQGLIVVTVAGNLELWFGSEATGSTQTLELPSSVVAWRIG